MPEMLYTSKGIVAMTKKSSAVTFSFPSTWLPVGRSNGLLYR
jgi:hypothetical protein